MKQSEMSKLLSEMLELVINMGTAYVPPKKMEKVLELQEKLESEKYDIKLVSLE